MGLHATIKTHLVDKMQHAVLHSIPAPPDKKAPTLCVVDFMWLLFRFSGSTGVHLTRFILRQAFEAFDGGIPRVAVLTDDPEKVPVQKHEEQKRRRVKRQKTEATRSPELLELADDKCPAEFVSAMMNTCFRNRVMAYLARTVPETLRTRKYSALAAQIVSDRFNDGDTELVACFCIGSHPPQTWAWNKSTGWRERMSPTIAATHGEADMAAVDVIRYFLKTDNDTGRDTGGVVVRTIDSDSIPILLMLLRDVTSDVPIMLWLPACGKKSKSGLACTYDDTDQDNPSVVSIARRVGGTAFVPAASANVRKRAQSEASSIWNYENKTLIRLNGLCDADNAVRLVVVCVIMGTDFNAKLIPGVGIAKIVSALSCVDIQQLKACFQCGDRLRSICSTVLKKPSAKKTDSEEFEKASWVLRYWSSTDTCA
ncbi:hypothetical protein CYMTET_44311 [Cymbomonas tetramitiformis]|uniref:Uncharacterized protein n=1 Tax=Cymbomonas tetramitiformis TaxID=36881 RepID=A0AAE0C266_9CHLO|nr:hypothetical protein CYMTET_44311 [Cymbomonas tetramitiformis]